MPFGMLPFSTAVFIYGDVEKTQDLEAGFTQAEKLISQGTLVDKLAEIRSFLNHAP